MRDFYQCVTTVQLSNAKLKKKKEREEEKYFNVY